MELWHSICRDIWQCLILYFTLPTVLYILHQTTDQLVGERKKTGIFMALLSGVFNSIRFYFRDCVKYVYDGILIIHYISFQQKKLYTL